MKLFKCIKTENNHNLELTKNEFYECAISFNDKNFMTVVDDFYKSFGDDLNFLVDNGLDCAIPIKDFKKMFKEVK